MLVDPSPRAQELMAKLRRFLWDRVFPREADVAVELATGERWAPLQVIEDLKAEAKAEGLWNLWLPDPDRGAGLTNLEYASMAELMGRNLWSPEVFNCSAPDTGNMEVLWRYGNDAQKAKWLEPLLTGPHPQCVCDDRARSGQLRCHKHPSPD